MGTTSERGRIRHSDHRSTQVARSKGGARVLTLLCDEQPRRDSGAALRHSLPDHGGFQ